MATDYMAAKSAQLLLRDTENGRAKGLTSSWTPRRSSPVSSPTTAEPLGPDGARAIAGRLGGAPTTLS